jgi:transcriptional regulator with XRE-family HTH domain
MEVITPFGEKLKKIRKEKDISDSELARRMGVSPPQVFNLYRTQNPQPKTLKKIAKIFSTPVGYWLDEEPIKSEPPKSDIKSANFNSTKDHVKIYLVVEADGKENRILIKDLPLKYRLEAFGPDVA